MNTPQDTFFIQRLKRLQAPRQTIVASVRSQSQLDQQKLRKTATLLPTRPSRGSQKKTTRNFGWRGGITKGSRWAATL